VGPGYPIFAFAPSLSIHFLVFCSLLLFLLLSFTLLLFFYCPPDPFLQELSQIPSNLRVLSICGTTIDSADVVRDLGVWLDSELTMKRHVSKIASTCFYHLRRLRQLRDKVSQGLVCFVL